LHGRSVLAEEAHIFVEVHSGRAPDSRTSRSGSLPFHPGLDRDGHRNVMVVAT
jgi:hypothetical protein